MILRIVLLGLILAGLAGFGTIAWTMLPAHSAAVAAPRKVAILTVTRAVSPGTLLKPEDLASTEVEENKVPAGAVPDEADAKRSLVGGLVRRPLSAGDMLLLPEDALRPSDHGFLSAVLSPGTRAVTVGVDMISGGAGLIWPGDRVDVILTQTLENQTVAPGRRIAAETVLRNARVIAIDQTITQRGNDTAPVVAKTVTLEVAPDKVEAIQVAVKLGRLSLALRSAESGPPDAGSPATTWAGDVSTALPKQAENAPPPSVVKVFQGAADTKEFRF